MKKNILFIVVILCAGCSHQNSNSVFQKPARAQQNIARSLRRLKRNTVTQADIVCLSNHASALAFNNEFMQADRLFEKVLQSPYCFFPEAVCFNQAKVSLMNSDWKRALRKLHDALTLEPDYSDAHYIAALIYQEQGCEQQAHYHQVRACGAVAR